MPPILCLTDSELDAIFSAARPLAVQDRDTFLRAVAHALQQECGEVGAGTVGRVCRELQRQYFDPPTIADAPRWSRANGGIAPRKRAAAGP